jgi:hypothetical protein
LGKDFQVTIFTEKDKLSQKMQKIKIWHSRFQWEIKVIISFFEKEKFLPREKNPTNGWSLSLENRFQMGKKWLFIRLGSFKKSLTELNGIFLEHSCIHYY